MSAKEGVSPSLSLSSNDQDAVIAKRIRWKLDLHVLPPVMLLLLASFTDRSNLGNAKIAGLEKDLHMVGNQYNVAVTVFSILYLLIDLPSNLVLKKFKANRWIPFLVALWGTVTTLTGLVKNYSGLLACRILLGMCEGGLLPGVVLYLSTMYKRHELQQRVGIFFSAACVAGACGGLLASGIINMNGAAGLSGWRWIFILEGIATFMLAILAGVVLPENLSSAKFLTDDEKEFALSQLHLDGIEHASGPSSSSTSTKSEAEKDPKKASNTDVQMFVYTEKEQFEWREVIRGCLDIQVWLTAACDSCILISLYSSSYFLPTIMTGLGYSGVEAQLRSAPPYLPATILSITLSVLGDKIKWRGPLVLMLMPLAIIGYIILITATNNTQRYVATFLVACGTWPAVPPLLTILPNNTSGHFKRATATGFMLVLANVGGCSAAFLYTSDQAPYFIRGHSINLALMVVGWFIMAANVVYCIWENKARAAGRRQSNIERYQELWDSGKTRAPIGDRHPDFRFTL